MEMTTLSKGLQKASELSKQLQGYRDSVEQKKKVIDFLVCFSCKSALEFDYLLEEARDHIIEKCHCPSCGATAPERKYRLQ
jgi:heterodisulfide reductase subunit A-like polyferredoxin